MKTLELIKEIKRLPLAKRFLVIEETLNSIKREGIGDELELVVEDLYQDYINDKELTAFTSLDFEHFYETK